MVAFGEGGKAVEMTRSVISEQMRGAVGTELSRHVSFPVSASDIRRWAIAVHYPEPPPRQYWDEEAAAASRYGGIVAPDEFNPFAWITAEPAAGTMSGGVGFSPDRIEILLGIQGPGLVNMLNGGIAVEYGVPMRSGDVITSVTRLGEYREREGSLGLMLFTSQVTVWTNQRGEVVRTTTATLIRY